MLNKVRNALLKNGIRELDSILVALSGGADSVALAYIMWQLSKGMGFKLFFAHVNHCLRGVSADNDQAFCEKFADKLGVNIFIKKADVHAIADELSISEEMAGRRVRYSFFEELMEKEGISYTATAHHKNDNAETIVMNFMRGTGLGGLRGIPVMRDKYIRPLIGASRCEIEEFCRANSLEYVTDETNNENKYTRNKIRNKLIPYIEGEFNSNFMDVITSNAEIIALEDECLKNIADAEYDKLVVDNAIETNALLHLPKAIALRVIRKMIQCEIDIVDISQAKVMDIYRFAKKNQTGRLVEIKGNVIAKTQYNKLVICKNCSATDDFCYSLSFDNPTYIKELGCTVSMAKATEKEKDGCEYFSLPSSTAMVIIRNRREGDVFYPKGLSGRKKVKEYMINEKIPREERGKVGILTFDDDIAWIIGHRRDERFDFKDNGIKIAITY